MNVPQQNLIDADIELSLQSALQDQRLISNVTDAQERAIKTAVINPANENFESNPNQKIPPTLIINPDDEALCMQDEIFGGIGASGMGVYHGIERFKTFSHAKAIYRQTKKFNVAKLAGLLPPYGAVSEKNIRYQIKR
jgi:acyl-CoA reductase-like NAD-dependent aldehyde dehydrogenase